MINQFAIRQFFEDFRIFRGEVMDNQSGGNRFHPAVMVFLPFVVTSHEHRAFHE